MRLIHVTAAAIALAGSTMTVGNGGPGAAAAESQIEVAVDSRFELFSVLERLAGAPEYGVAATPYSLAADEWFAPHAADPAVITLRRLRAENGIGYDAALTLAAQLDEQLRPVRSLSPLPEGLDPRWEGVDLEAVLDEVREFAAESNFDEFIATQATTPHRSKPISLSPSPIVPW